MLRIVVLFIGVLMTACGGSSDTKTVTGGGGTSLGQSEPELISNSVALVNQRYVGSSQDIVLDSASAQEVFKTLFGSDYTTMPDVFAHDLGGMLNSGGEIDSRLSCDGQGTVDYKGKLDENFEGNIDIQYNNCYLNTNNFAMTGDVVLGFTNLTENGSDIIYYFDNLTWELDGKTIKLTGYSQFEQTVATSGVQLFKNTQDLLFDVVEVQQLRAKTVASIPMYSENGPLNINGELYLGNQGKVQIFLDNAMNEPPRFSAGKLEIQGANKAMFDFSGEYIQLKADSTNDGNFDIGTYFISFDELLDATAEDKVLVSLSELSLPPSVNKPYLPYSESYDVTTPITVQVGSYYDPDTATQDLTFSHRWYLNGELIPDQTSATLPPYIAVFGDQLEVATVVNDGSNSVEGPRRTIVLEDAPLNIEVTGLPETLMAGDTVEFMAVVSDPDTGPSDVNGVLISGPEGASMNSEGLVTWQVPSQLTLSHQNYYFNFGFVGGNGDTNELTPITVTVKGDKPLPMSRSGIEVPQKNHSMFVGDFDGDDLNEVLSTDGTRSVFLLEFDGSQYRQKWHYPFKPATAGQIVQVLGANLDSDAELEIITVTEHGISVTMDLESVATVLLETEEHILSATHYDLDQDGIAELAYLHSSSTYSSSNTFIDVIAVDSPDTPLFSDNVSSAKQAIFANVDQDQQPELILNNGLVYDALSWQNQWMSGTSFGDHDVTAGDYNGDGVDEIAGANTWGNVTVYSAQSKTQLYTFDNFNTCTLHSANIDNDNHDELLIGDCQWGDISAYNFEDNQLKSSWKLDMQGHGSISLVSGDSDNDGLLEVHWGTGVSSTGEDSFITADIARSGSASLLEGGSPQLDFYQAAGWSALTANEEKAVFFIPSTGSGYDDSSIAMLEKTGEVTLSDTLSSNWSNDTHAVTTDFNNDGFGDIIVPTTQTYDGSIALMQLNNHSIHWQTEGNYDSNIGQVDAADVNHDSYDDVLYVDNTTLRVVDAYNQTLLGTYTVDYGINDFVVNRIDDVSAVIVSHFNTQSLLTLNTEGLSEQTSVNMTCHRLVMMNYDVDNELELVCLNGSAGVSSSPSSLVVYDVTTSSLTEIARHQLTENVIDIAVDPSKDAQQDLWLITQTGNGGYFDFDTAYYLKKANYQGSILWSSLPLVGKPTEKSLNVRQTVDGEVEILLSTEDAMYWIY